MGHKNVVIKTQIPGPRSRELVEKEQLHLAPGLQGFALWAGVAMAHGRGSTLTDVDGNTYVDLIGGIGVNALGHCHPRYVAALTEQAHKLTVGSFTSAPRAELVGAVCEMAPAGLDRLQLYSSGAEAVESALRLARCATGRQDVMGSAARHGLGPLPSGTTLVPYADCYRCPIALSYPSCSLACVDLVRRAMAAQAAGPVAAVIAEPMQGTAGNVIPPQEFVRAMADAAHEMGALFIADEMITGFGRTGKPWGVDHSGARPDICTLGKGFGSGFPISGVLTRSDIAQSKPWSNPSGASSSYGGNALAAAAALASVSTIRDERLWDNAAEVGAAMLAELKRMQESHPFVGDVRGCGLLLGIEVVKDRRTKEPVCVEVMREVYVDCIKRGLLAMAYTPHIRLQPALTIDRETALEGLAILDEVFSELSASGRWRS